MTLEERVQADHPDWTDEQVAAEVTRLRAEQAADDTSGRARDDASDARDRAFAELRRRAERAERELAAFRRAEEERTRREAEEQGRWEELARRLEQERDQLRAELEGERVSRQVERLAVELRFHRSDEALALLPQGLDRSNADAVREALEQLARERPHLVASSQGGATGGPSAGTRPQGMSRDEVAALARENPAEFNRRFEAGEIPASALGGS